MYKRCMLIRFYNLAKCARTNVPSYVFPAGFSRVLLPAAVGNVSRVQTEIASFLTSITAVLFFKFSIIYQGFVGDAI